MRCSWAACPDRSGNRHSKEIRVSSLNFESYNLRKCQIQLTHRPHFWLHEVWCMLPSALREARDPFFCLTVFLCLRGAVPQPRSTGTRRTTTTSTTTRRPWMALGAWLPHQDVDDRI